MRANVQLLSESASWASWDCGIVYCASSQAPRSISLHLSEQKGKYLFGIRLLAGPVCFFAGALQIGHLGSIFDANRRLPAFRLPAFRLPALRQRSSHLRE